MIVKYTANSPEEYVAQLPVERQAAVQRLREAIKATLPEGFEECMNYGMIGYVVPHSLYPGATTATRACPCPL